MASSNPGPVPGGPLTGVRVVELSRWLMVPAAAAILGDLGADVIKVEDRVRGDSLRGAMDAVVASLPFEVKRNFVFEYANHNKRGMTLDVGKPEGKAVLFRLLEKSDVFLHNYLEATAMELGLDYASVARCNPKIIYGRGSGWGPKGADSGKPAYEAAAIARSGWAFLAGESGMPPLHYATGFGDLLGGLNLALGVISALFVRERIALGQELDVSLLGSLIALEAVPATYTALHGADYGRRDRAKTQNPLLTYYQCGDGQWIFLSMLQPDKYWSRVCSAMGICDLEHDPRFENIESRRRHAGELLAILDEKFRSKPRAEWMRLFDREGLIYAPINRISETMADPQAEANGYIVNFHHPGLGQIKAVGSPYMFSKTPASLRRAAPEFGQHTEEILRETGYTWDDIAKLKDREVI
ncbi:MAG: CoA transferase [Chloroflexi bacterium]|nr:CoA transferase [Chloroflexota bacterium]